MIKNEYIKNLEVKLGNQLLRTIKKDTEFEDSLEYVTNTLDKLITQEKISEEDAYIIWDDLINIINKYKEKTQFTLYEHVNIDTVDLVKMAKNNFKKRKVSTSDLMMSRKVSTSDLLMSRKGLKK